jgi:ABC-type glycerol-3-phosphate transport system substrate-binding protein
MQRFSLWGLTLTLIGVVLIIHFSKESSDVSVVEEAAPVSFEAWVFHEGTAAELERLGKEIPHLQLDIRRFRSPDQLFEELIAAISVNDAPQLAEVNSLQYLEQLIDSGALQPVDADRYEVGAAEKWRTYFSQGEQLWAVPISAAVPVMFYNGDWLRFGGIHEPQQLTTWAQMIEAASKRLQSLPQDRAAVHWGLVTDNEFYWYLQQLAPSSSMSETLAVLKTWHRMLYEDEIMPPLSHHLAATTFVGGRAGFFLTSSGMRERVEPYIGGKFKYGVLPLPETTQLVAKVDGLAVFAEHESTKHVAMRLAARMTEQSVQARLFQQYGKLSVRDELGLEPQSLNEMQQVLLTLSEQVRPIKRTANPILQHERYTLLLEQVELMEHGWDEAALREWMKQAGISY